MLLNSFTVSVEYPRYFIRETISCGQWSQDVVQNGYMHKVFYACMQVGGTRIQNWIIAHHLQRA